MIRGGLVAACFGSVMAAATPPAAAQRPVVVRDELRIPPDGPDYFLNRVASVVPLPGGGLAAARLSEADVLIFDRAGRLVRRLGRSGSGPGEFRRPTRLGLRGDTLWISDHTLGRLTLWPIDGERPLTIPVPIRGDGVLLADGRPAVLPLTAYRTERAFVQEILFMTRFARGAGRTDTLVAVPSWHHVFRLALGRDRWTVGMQPLEDGPLVAVAHDGSSIAIVDRRVSGGPHPAFRIVRLSPRGDTLGDHRLRYDPVPIRADAIEALARERTTPPGSTDPGEIRRVRNALWIPGHHPTVTAVVVGPRGTIWLRREDEGRPTVRWTIVDPAGRIEAEAELPTRLRLTAVEGRRGWGVEDRLEGPWLRAIRVGR